MSCSSFRESSTVTSSLRIVHSLFCNEMCAPSYFFRKALVLNLNHIRNPTKYKIDTDFQICRHFSDDVSGNLQP